MFGNKKVLEQQKTAYYIGKRADLDSIIVVLEQVPGNNIELLKSLKAQQTALKEMNINTLVSVTETSAVGVVKEVENIMQDGKVNWLDSYRFYNIFGILRDVWSKLALLKGEFKDLTASEIEVWLVVLIKRTIATLNKYRKNDNEVKA